MFAVDPSFQEEWPDVAWVCFDVPRTQEVFRELTDVIVRGRGWEDSDEYGEPGHVVPTPDGFVTVVEYGTPRLLSLWIEELERSGQLSGSVRPFDGHIPFVRGLLRSQPWLVAWFRPRKQPSAFAEVLDAAAGHLSAGRIESVVQHSSAMLRLPVADVREWLDTWTQYGCRVSLARIDKSESVSPVAVLVPRDGGLLVGVGYGIVPLGSAGPWTTRLFERLVQMMVDLAPVTDYAVATVHWKPTVAQFGTPFSDRDPATEMSRLSIAHAISILDRVVLDVGPIQVVGPHHDLEQDDDTVVTRVAGDRRLVRVGSLDAWLDANTEQEVIARGRDVFAPSLPDHQAVLRLIREVRDQHPGT